MHRGLLSMLVHPYSSNGARRRFSLDHACYVKFMDGQIQSCGVRMVQNFIGRCKLNLSIGSPTSIKRATHLAS